MVLQHTETWESLGVSYAIQGTEGWEELASYALRTVFFVKEPSADPTEPHHGDRPVSPAGGHVRYESETWEVS